ncbi:hypothetical protein ABZV24_22845 [Streptomyces sp. NPDC005251]|uniref:hypothetical protein n=1 Tax=Streptomyces sp. NPDC005251 TaxID=3157166 RepID=UPI0033A5D3FC
MSGAEPLIVPVVLCVALRALFVASRGMYHRWRLPRPSIALEQLETFQRQVFREVCRRSKDLSSQVRMANYFIGRGWNRADALLILHEPIKHGLIKIRGWRFGTYGPTRRGWAEYRKNFMWTGGSEAVDIRAEPGGFVAVNVNSPHAVAQAGPGNRVDQGDVSHRQLIDALREDARTAVPGEAARAQEYAEDLGEAVQAGSPDRTARILNRINALLVTAGSAFSLTRGLLPPGT